MAGKKERLAELLEKYLPKLADKEPEYVRECLRLILRRLGYRQYLLAIEQAKNPIEFGYNIYLWTQGLVKEVRRTGTLKKGKTYREKQIAKGYSEDEIKEDREGEGTFNSNALIEVDDGWIRLGATKNE